MEKDQINYIDIKRQKSLFSLKKSLGGALRRRDKSLI